MIRDLVHDFRAASRQQLKDEYPGIAAEMQTLKNDAMAAAVR